MSKNEKWYLMRQVFTLTPMEIAELDGNTTNRNVSIAICRYGQRVEKGKRDFVYRPPVSAGAFVLRSAEDRG